jgi:hypothetical protein
MIALMALGQAGIKGQVRDRFNELDFDLHVLISNIAARDCSWIPAARCTRGGIRLPFLHILHENAFQEFCLPQDYWKVEVSD